MKKTLQFSIAFALLLVCGKAQAQCPTPNSDGYVYLSSQAEVDAFIINYPNCTEIEGGLLIGDYENPSDITNLLPLSNLTSVGGFEIYAGGLEIFNSQLTSLSGLESLIWVGELNIVGNNALISLSGLNNLTTITTTGNLVIFENNVLTSLTALDNLTSVGGLSIYLNPQLTSLSGLNNLNYVGWILDIYGNSQLTDISALQNVNLANVNEEWWSGLFIWNNSLLEVCNLPNFCAYLANDPDTHPRDIYDNAGDCISEQAVLNACSLSMEDNAFSEVTVYPNPVKDILHFSQEIHKITLTDLTGKVLSTQNNSSQTDISGLKNGVYLVIIETENGLKETKKVVKR